MDDDHCVITTQHRICEIPIAANKRQFSVFVNMSAAWVLPNDDANIKKRNLNLQEKKNFVLLQCQSAGIVFVTMHCTIKGFKSGFTLCR